MLKIYAAATEALPTVAELRKKLPGEWLTVWDRQHLRLTRDAAVRASLGGLWLLHASGITGELSYTQNGRPFLDGYDVDFSITHTEDYVFCSVLTEANGERIGLDAEALDRTETWNFTALAARWFSPLEREAFEKEATAACFLSVWTRKEAAIKQSGEGMQALAKTDTVLLEKTGKLAFFVYRVQNNVVTLAIDGESCVAPDADIIWRTKES